MNEIAQIKAASAIPDRRLNSIINRRAWELAHQLLPGIKAYLLERIIFEQQSAGATTEINERFYADVLRDTSLDEALLDVRSNL